MLLHEMETVDNEEFLMPIAYSSNQYARRIVFASAEFVFLMWSINTHLSLFLKQYFYNGLMCKMNRHA